MDWKASVEIRNTFPGSPTAGATSAGGERPPLTGLSHGVRQIGKSRGTVADSTVEFVDDDPFVEQRNTLAWVHDTIVTV